MQPEILVLDEPTAQLDPIAASDFIGALKKINTELGTTVLLAEHRLEEVFPLAHKAVLMDKARIFLTDTPRNVGNILKASDKPHKMLAGLPSGIRIFGRLDAKGDCPLTVGESRQFLEKNYGNRYPGYDVSDEDYSEREKAVEISEGLSLIHI